MTTQPHPWCDACQSWHSLEKVTCPRYWEQHADQPWTWRSVERLPAPTPGYHFHPGKLALALLLWMLLIAVICLALAVHYLPMEAGPSVPRRTRPAILYPFHPRGQLLHWAVAVTVPAAAARSLIYLAPIPR